MPPYPEHLRGFDYTGPNRYFLTFCTWERVRHFTNGDHVTLVCEQFQRASREQGFAVTAYCFMPDHVHLLVSGERDDADLKRFTKSAKQYSGFYFRRTTGLLLWQRYGFERTLRNEEATAAVARYTIANPVRAELVQSPADYPFWGSFVYTREALLEYIGRAA
jgi:putative transposase